MKMTKIRDAYAKHLTKWDWPITLNLNYGRGISRWRVEQTAKRFWNWIDRDLYGRALVDSGRRLGRFCVIDGWAAAENWHYHCAVKRPPFEYFGGTVDDFCVVLRKRWECLDEAGAFSLCAPAKSQIAWLKYICGKDVSEAGEVCKHTTVMHL